jgi:hypothetical protein
MRVSVVCLLFLVWGSSAQAGTVAVFPVEHVNLRSGDASAIAAMIAHSYGVVSGDTVLSPAMTGAALKGAPGYSLAARQLEADEYLVVSVVQLSTRLQLQVGRFKAEGTRVYRVAMSLLGLDDLEEGSARIAASLHGRRPLVETRTLQTVTGREGQTQNRVFTEKLHGLKMASVHMAAKGRRFAPALRTQYDLRLETETMFLEFGAGFVIPNTARGYSGGPDEVGGLFLELGGARYLSQDSVSTYVGAGISPRILWGRDSGGVGVAPYASLGAMFMREASTRMYIEVRAYQNLFSFVETTYEYPESQPWEPPGAVKPTVSRRSYRPTEFTLEIGIGW